MLWRFFVTNAPSLFMRNAVIYLHIIYYSAFIIDAFRGTKMSLMQEVLYFHTKVVAIAFVRSVFLILMYVSLTLLFPDLKSWDVLVSSKLFLCSDATTANMVQRQIWMDSQGRRCPEEIDVPCTFEDNAISVDDIVKKKIEDVKRGKEEGGIAYLGKDEN